ncbi:hypothetical protein MRQ86_14775 [Streptomyces sp. MMS21 TC-5]|uniref:hypothetical protein n=1 Tax=Streptomyces sp. MMS21 TC-5 TaxID=2925833 RepID=UPI001F602D6E|nr:hypothetical protein [Streptomyces sp. MMS21 TC-5]MCI4081584.1 hypothetical protein [Streptomyces sp. MMS21 TC-5]
MKLSPNSAPAEPDDLLIRMHNQVGAAVDVTGTRHSSYWSCHGCGYGYGYSSIDHHVDTTRTRANHHAAECRAAFHRIP